MSRAGGPVSHTPVLDHQAEVDPAFRHHAGSCASDAENGDNGDLPDLGRNGSQRSEKLIPHA